MIQTFNLLYCDFLYPYIIYRNKILTILSNNWMAPDLLEKNQINKNIYNCYSKCHCHHHHKYLFDACFRSYLLGIDTIQVTLDVLNQKYFAH